MNVIKVAIVALSLVSTNVLAMGTGGIEVGGDVTQSVAADNIINLGMGSNVTAEQTVASVAGQVSVKGSVKQTVNAKNLINLGMGSGVTARQTIASMNSH